MKNILLISTIYPLPDSSNQGTKVCHFFAKEWMKLGYSVRVVHLQAVYPRVLYAVARLMRNRIAAKTGAVVYVKRDSKAVRYDMDGIPVTRIPVFKPVPHGRFQSRSVRHAVECIEAINTENGFVPDYVIGHFTNPVLQVVGRLKDLYGARACVVVHGDVDLTKRVYGEELPGLVRKIDVWGFRSNHVKSLWEKYVAPVDESFICYSGIPERYIADHNGHVFHGPLKNFLYVGEMIERKYPEKILTSLLDVYADGDYHMAYVGDGHLVGAIRELVSARHLESKVTICGKLNRDEILQRYDAADCMVMISKAEAYGLVYLEAMARGCIVIASRNEGFDGIIKDGVNGFLCKAGDAGELAAVIRRINALTDEEKHEVSEAAIATARWLTDSNAAKMYIDNVL